MYWFLYDQTGNIQEKWLTDATKWDNLNGYAGALSVAETDTTAQDAFVHSSHYQVQNNTLVSVVTPAQLLAEAQAAQITMIEAGLASPLSGGFTSKTTGHTYPTDAAAQSNFTGAVTVFTTNPAKVTVPVQTLDAGWIVHTKADFFAMYNDGDAWKEAQYTQLQILIGQVQAATTVAAVQAITWTPATY